MTTTKSEYYVLVRPAKTNTREQPHWRADSVRADAGAAIARTLAIEKAAPYTDTSVVHASALTDAQRELYDAQIAGAHVR